MASHGGTYTAHSVSLASAAEFLPILDGIPALETLAGYGSRLMGGISGILNARGIVHSYTGHPSMFGLFFDAVPLDNYLAWKTSDYTFYDRMAYFLHDLGSLVEPDSREPWFIWSIQVGRHLPARHFAGSRIGGGPDAGIP